MAWLPGWKKRIKLTIDQGDIDDALVDFPILVYLSTSSGRNNADVSAVFDELQSDANRKKIAIALPNSIIECYVEIEKWDDANEEAWLWVKVPAITSGVDTNLYLYYDKDHADNTDYVGDTNSAPAENVWDEHFKLVCHMRDDPDNEHVRDSTGNNNDGTKDAPGNPAEVAGQIGDCQSYDATRHIDMGDVVALEDTISVEASVKGTHAGNRGGIVAKWAASKGYLFWNDFGTFSWIVDGTANRVNSAGFLDGAWHRFVGTLVGGAMVLYKDGRSVGTDAGATLSLSAEHLYVGSYAGGSNDFEDLIDEVRISDINRSPEWVKADKESLWDDLVAFGGEELFDLASQVFITDTGVQIRKGSLSIEQRIEERSIAEFTVIDLAETASYQRGQAVEIYDVNGTLIFGGIIDTPDKSAMAPSGGLYHPIRCVDWHYLADKRLVVAAWAAPTDAGVIATALHTDYLAGEGVTIGSIQAGPEIPEAIFNYVTVVEALDILAEMAGFTWFIDELKRLFFIDRATYLAPWNWSPATPKPTGSLASLSSGNPLYRNRQYIRGGMGLTVLQTEDRTGDGVADVFIMSFPLAKEPDITEDAAPMDVGIRGLETGKDYYWSKGDNIIYAEVAPAGAVAIQFQYYGQYPLISLALDEGARIARQAIEGGTGIVEDIIYEAHDSGVSSQESARAKLTDYCRDAARFRYSTTDSGIKPGQLQTINYPLLGLSDVEMLVESVTITPYGNLVSHDITAIVGPVTGSWTRFYSTILRRQIAAIRIGDERLLALLQQLETLSLVEAPTSWQQLKGQYCWAPKTNGVGLREARWGFFTWG